MKKEGYAYKYLILLIIFIVWPLTTQTAQRSPFRYRVAEELGPKRGINGVYLLCIWLGLLANANPVGWLLDKFGSKKVYTYSLFFWSLFTFLQGFVTFFRWRGQGFPCLSCALCSVSLEAPSFPANARIVATWFQTKERGTPSAIFNSAHTSPSTVLAAAGLAELPGLGTCLYRHGGDWLVLTAMGSSSSTTQPTIHG
ncbi:MFS transporter [Shigella flexneri]